MGIVSGIRNFFAGPARNTAWARPNPAGAAAGPGTMRGRQRLWRDMYMNNAPWLAPGRVYSTNLACIAAGEVARLVTLGIRSNVDDAAMNALYNREVVWDLRNQAEYGLAFGGLAIKPYVASPGTVKVAFVHPCDYEIAAVDTDGTILEMYFRDHEKAVGENGEKGAHYIRVERHALDRRARACLITNEVYRADGGGEGGARAADARAALGLVPRWAGIAPEQEVRNVDAPLFGFFRPATSNSVDPGSPHGVSIFDKAVPSIEMADRQLSAMIREFKIKEGRLYVDRVALDLTAGRGGRVPHLEDDFYVKMEADGRDGRTFFEVFSPDIRSDAYLRAFNKFQQLVEDNMGLMHGTFSAPDVTDRSATEVRESKHRTYSTVAANQKALQRALQETADAMAAYLGRGGPGPEVSTVFDDSLVNDPQETLAAMKDDVACGLLRPEVYLAKKYGTTEAEALKLMPSDRQLLRPDNTRLIWTEHDLAEDGRGE